MKLALLLSASVRSDLCAVIEVQSSGGATSVLERIEIRAHEIEEERA